MKTLKNDTIKKAYSEKEEERGEFVAGVTDLAMEMKFLSILKHPHIIKMRGIASVHPCQESFFIVLDRLYETLQQKVDDTWTKEAQKLSGRMGLFLGTKGSRKAKLAKFA